MNARAAATGETEPASPPLAGVPVSPAMQRARVSGRISVKERSGRTWLDALFQEGAAKIRIPRNPGASLEAVLINTSGGLTGGDAMSWSCAAEDGTALMITVDCGITDVEPVDVANKLGVDVIITDHHLQNGDLPKAYTILNPNQNADDTYPFKGLCGAGVAFKLVQGLIQKGDFNIVTGWDKWLLDMAGLSTIADMVPLTGENRAIARYGLHVLRKSRRPGLQQLLRKIRVDQRFITEDDVGFMIGPRINAASRMDHPMDAFELLATDDVVRGGEELAKLRDGIHHHPIYSRIETALKEKIETALNTPVNHCAEEPEAGERIPSSPQTVCRPSKRLARRICEDKRHS